MVRLAAAAAHFTRDIGFDLDRIKMIISHARDAGVSLLALPDGALGGYLTDLRGPDEDDLPPLLEPNGDEVRSVIDFAGDMVVCLGYSERGLDEGNGLVRYDAAVCLSGDGILGRHRKVHLPAGIAPLFAAGDGFRAFDTPVGRMGLLIDHDKTFPEAARALAVDGAEIIACLSAWPTSLTNRAPRMAQDRQARLFDLYDQARAAENQVVLALGQPERAVRRRCTSWAGRRSSGRVGTSSRARGRRAGWRWRRSTSRSWSGRPGRCCTISPSVVRRPTVDRADRPADLLDEAARRCGAHARAGRGVRPRRARR